MEDEIRKEVQVSDLQIWGFRHERGKPINDALVAISKAAHSPSENHPQLGEQLEAAFRRSVANEVFEELSITRHRILRSFVAIRLNLEHAAEVATKDPNRAAALFEGAIRKIPEKLAEARHVLSDQARMLENDSHAERGKIKDKIDSVARLLSDLPQLEATVDPRSGSTAFNAWLTSLDASLDQLREALK
jgi:hypothetical protein